MSDASEREPIGRDIVAGLVLGLALALVLVWLGHPAPGPPAPPEGAQARPLVVVSIDGLGWDLLDPMIQAGELAAFAGLARWGLRGQLVVQQADRPLATLEDLASRAGLRSIVLDDAEHAARAVASEPFDLMLLHLRLPEQRYALMPDAYRRVDRHVGTLMAELDENVNLLVLASRPHATGVLLGLGPDLARGEVPALLSTDVIPTLCALLDLPIPREESGEVATSMFSETRRPAMRSPG